MIYLPITSHNQEQVNAFIERHWFTKEMIICGEIVDMTKVEGVLAVDGDQIAGLITFRIKDGVCEITSLDSQRQGKGIGTALLEQVIAIASEKNCLKLKLITTNDNIHAIRFYQKRGFKLVKLHYDSIKQARLMKPEIPLIGQNGIPIKHELEFELILQNK